MVACGTFASGLTDPVAVALIVVGAGMFFIGTLLPSLTEFSIGPGGFSAKLRERDAEVQATLEPNAESLMNAAIALSGDAEKGKELFERAVVETYMTWKQAKREGPAEAVRKQIEGLAVTSGPASPAADRGAA